jgi:hypothetical protein
MSRVAVSETAMMRGAKDISNGNWWGLRWSRCAFRWAHAQRQTANSINTVPANVIISVMASRSLMRLLQYSE